MIKCDKGRIEIKGTPMVLVGELRKPVSWHF